MAGIISLKDERPIETFMENHQKNTLKASRKTLM